MILIATIQQASLTDAPPSSAIGAASDWISALLFGPLATALAVIAIAWVGFAMLSGRIDVRRGVAVIFACFLLFGARGVADGLRSAATNDTVAAVAEAPPPPVFPSASKRPPNGNAFDPYAGAAVPQR
jgi:type IV secretory pathway VirB2 component (pilin)